MKIETLGNLIGLTKGKKHQETDDSNTSRYLQIEDVNGACNLKFTKEKGVQVKSDDIILVWDGANAGKVGIGLNGIIGSTLSRMSIDTKTVYPKYLFWFLQSKFDFIKSQRTGATIPHVSQSSIKALPIPIFPIPDQQRIATILDHADSIRRKNRQILEKYNELAQSVFYEMFGDPEKNQFGFKIGTIRDLVSEVKYGTSNKSSDKGSYPYLRMNNLTYDGNMDYSNLKYVDIKDNEKDKYTVRNGDILFNRTNSKELVGKTAVFKSKTEMVIAGYLIRIRVNQIANPEYISAYLNSKHGKTTLFGMCKSIIGMANINAQEMQNIKILIPPIDLQNRFAQIVEHIANQKSLTQKSLEKSENLFQSLLQKAFKGEL